MKKAKERGEEEDREETRREGEVGERRMDVERCEENRVGGYFCSSKLECGIKVKCL